MNITRDPEYDRLARIRRQIRSARVDALALVPSDNLRYVAGFSPLGDERFSVLFVTPDLDAFVIPAVNADETADTLPGIRMFRWEDNEGATEALTQALASLGGDRVQTLAVDPEMRAEALLALLEAAPHIRPVNGAALIRSLREIKQADEIAALARSAATADIAIRAAVGACRPGVTELDVAATAHTAFRTAGAEYVCFADVQSGPNGAFPHHESSNRTLQVGDAIVIDLGGRLDGYSSDITRMVHIGQPSPRYLEIHEIVERALQKALAVARPGATCGDVDDAARRVIAGAGYAEYFPHRTGHGLGLSIHEPPWIMDGEDVPLQAGMVFSIEPGIYLKNEFGVRLEEIVHVTDTGAEIFSSLSRTLEVRPA